MDTYLQNFIDRERDEDQDRRDREMARSQALIEAEERHDLAVRKARRDAEHAEAAASAARMAAERARLDSPAGLLEQINSFLVNTARRDAVANNPIFAVSHLRQEVDVLIRLMLLIAPKLIAETTEPTSV